MKDNDEMRNYISNNNEDYKVKYYNLYSIINYINEIIKKIELENVFSSEFNKFFKEIFINFDYIGKKIIWTLLIKNSYLIYVITSNNYCISGIRNKFIKNKLSSWKQNLCKDEKIKNTIDSLTRNYDEERIIEFLKDKIKSDLDYGTCYGYYEYEFLDKYYSIIYSLLSLSNECEVVTKKEFNENNNIRELLIIPKDNLETNTLNNNKTDIVYIIINYSNIVEKGCIEALDYNENLVFDDIKLKEKYDKIIKFGIAFNEEIWEKFQYASNENCYLIDKTKIISKLINHDENDAYLITRPRRFGKSLNLRMIKDFFEKPVNEKENEDKEFVFDGLEVSKDRKNMRHFHKYPVIYLNFKSNNSKEDDNSSIINFLKTEISSVFNYYKKRIDFNKLSKIQQEEWNKIEQKSDGVILQNTIKFLCTCLKEFYKRNCIILIDEYNKIFSEKLKSESTFGTIQTFFSDTFKGNDYLHFGIVTGCLDIGLNELNSGANNFTKCSLLKDNYFSDCYGFTEDELKNVLSNFNISDSKEKSIIKSIYNPYSIMKFVQKNKNKGDNFELSNYWIYSEKNEKLKNLLKNIDLSFDNYSPIEYNYLKKDNSYKDIWKVLFFSGYLTVADEEEYKENIKNMNNKMIKIKSNKSKLMEIDSNEIQSNKNNLLEKKELNDIIYFKIPNQEVLEYLHHLIDELNKK
ncbi:hypothetical protein H8356DRAFT_1286807 [Neocallimastix lanati (nom. inval.)]|nr:hypothetical protein H8356DRAFT_1286807 [Neocallimastix sp. JGI-2020a]